MVINEELKEMHKILINLKDDVHRLEVKLKHLEDICRGSTIIHSDWSGAERDFRDE